MSRTHLKLGFARLSDCAPLVIAKERGAFEKHGLEVELKRYASWAAMRDALAHGVIDAAQMLAPMVVASSGGLGPYPGLFKTSFALNLNGNAITVSNALHEQLKQIDPECFHKQPLTPHGLRAIVERRRTDRQAPLTFAHVYHYSMHGYELRYWLSAAGINPETDVKLVVIPPERMVESLSRGLIDGYCVGEPWNSAAIDAGLGKTLVTSAEIWSNAPEKVLAVRCQWSDQNRDTHLAMLKALLDAAQWLDVTDNRLTAAEIISQSSYVDMPVHLLQSSLTGQNVISGGSLLKTMPDFNVFHRYTANFPWRSHARWIFGQMVRWGEALAETDADEVVKLAYDVDIYRQAAKESGVPCPLIDEKPEGAHAHAWLLEDATSPIAMGADHFMDGRIYAVEQAGLFAKEPAE